MVVAGHPEAAAIGASILNRGGTAMDAVVATGFALGVAEPYGSGIGGKCVILYYEAASGRTWYIDGMDASGSSIDIERLVSADSEERAEGALGVGVPGMVAAMHMGHGMWGQLPWPELLEPAIELARDGFLVAPGQQEFFKRRLERIESNPECSRLYLPGGSLPVEGSRLANPDLAETMEAIAREGRNGFYEGKIASRIVNGLNNAGSDLTMEDFSNYEARIRQPLAISYGDHYIISSGRPVSGGAMALLSLKILEQTDFTDGSSLDDPAIIDTWGRAFRHLYPLIQANMADTDDYTDRWDRICSEFQLHKLRKDAFSQDSMNVDIESEVPAQADSGWTTHFVVADKYGNAASVTQSLSHHFGSGVIIPGTGVVLNNSLTNFSFSNPVDVNYVAANKRPRSTISPILVMRNKRPLLAMGLPGGGRIPTTTSALLMDYLEFGAEPGNSIAARRFHLLRDWSAEPVSKVFQVEAGFDQEIMEALRHYGWQVEETEDLELFGGVTAIELKQDGRLIGWADHRRTNHAVAAGGN